MVIIILGILAVVALPKFINLSSDAYQSTMRGVAGAVSSAKNMVHSGCLVSSDCDETAPAAAGNGLGNSIEVQGEDIILAFGYPRHTATGIARAINIEDVADGGEFRLTSYTLAGRAGIRIRPDADFAANECEIRYSQPQFAGDTPLIAIEVDDC